jgi:ATP phosphoribosyltransferase
MFPLTIALSRGRIFDETLPLLAAAGIAPEDDPEASRKLILASNRADLRFVIVRASDVPTYVQHGAADLGVAGKDVLLEHGGEGLYQPVDLAIGRCRLVVAARRDFDYAAPCSARPAQGRHQVRRRRANAFRRQGNSCRSDQAVRVDGARAAGGLADLIVDLVSTGKTLQANDLVVVEEIRPISARLIVNPAALKLKRDAVQPILDAIAKAVPRDA